MNCRPLSDMIMFDKLNRHIIFFQTKFWTFLADIDVRGSTSIHIVK